VKNKILKLKLKNPYLKGVGEAAGRIEKVFPAFSF